MAGLSKKVGPQLTIGNPPRPSSSNKMGALFFLGVRRMSLARLWPREQSRPTDSQVEQRVYDALSRTFPKGWTAWHSLRVRTEHGLKGEGDFVFTIPGRDFLVLEVKGGSLEMRDDRWFQNGHPLDKAPREQAHGFANFRCPCPTPYSVGMKIVKLSNSYRLPAWRFCCDRQCVQRNGFLRISEPSGASCQVPYEFGPDMTVIFEFEGETVISSMTELLPKGGNS